jgi:Conjugal transfer protein TraD
LYSSARRCYLVDKLHSLKRHKEKSLRSLSERLRAFEQQKARLADTEIKLRLAEKKARSRRLIETGALVEKARLNDLAVEALYGALLSLREGTKNPKQIEQWTNVGTQALAQDAKTADSEPIVLTFRAPLEKDAMARLRSFGFRFNKVLRHWEGVGSVADAEDLARAYGGEIRRVSQDMKKSDAAQTALNGRSIHAEGLAPADPNRVRHSRISA